MRKVEQQESGRLIISGRPPSASSPLILSSGKSGSMSSSRLLIVTKTELSHSSTDDLLQTQPVQNSDKLLSVLPTVLEKNSIYDDDKSEVNSVINVRQEEGSDATAVHMISTAPSNTMLSAIFNTRQQSTASQ